jgi:dihydroneopterin aldolase
MNNIDKIICKGLPFQCEIGFYGHEKGIKQKLSLDLEAFVRPMSPRLRDKVKGIRFDYHKAYQLIEKSLSQRRTKLVETVAEDVARLLLLHFDILAIKVSVTKYPLGKTAMHSVTYECFRKSGR